MSIKPELLNSFSFFFINGFIVVYFSLVILWLSLTNLQTIKKENPQSSKLVQQLSPITGFTGLEQNWGFFCPNVRSDNHYSLAVISLQNGFLKLCEMPRIEKMNILEKMQREKFRKIFNDNFPYQSFHYMRPAFSRFLARAAYSKYNPPASMSYFLISNPIPSPHWLSANLSPKELQESNIRPGIRNYFVYGISPDDFQ